MVKATILFIALLSILFLYLMTIILANLIKIINAICINFCHGSMFRYVYSFEHEEKKIDSDKKKPPAKAI